MLRSRPCGEPHDSFASRCVAADRRRDPPRSRPPDTDVHLCPRTASRSCLRELRRSSARTFRRCHSTVRGLRNSWVPSRLVPARVPARRHGRRRLPRSGREREPGRRAEVTVGQDDAGARAVDRVDPGEHRGTTGDEGGPQDLRREPRPRGPLRRFAARGPGCTPHLILSPTAQASSHRTCSGVSAMSSAERESSSSPSVRGPINGTTGNGCART